MKQSSYLFLGILAVIAVLGLFLMSTPVQETPKSTPNETVEVDLATTAQEGDLVKINYVLRFENGSVADTNNAALAEEAKLTTYSKGPTSLILGQSSKVKGFDEALAGMKEGEQHTAVIEPSEEQIIIAVNKTQKEWRFKSLPRFQPFPVSQFEVLFNKPPVIGDVVSSDRFPWRYQVANLSDDTAVGKMIVREGETYQLPGLQWKSKVFQVYPDVVSFFHVPEDNLSIETKFGPATIVRERQWIVTTIDPEVGRKLLHHTKFGNMDLEQTFMITKEIEDHFVIERVGNLADKRLTLEVELLELTKNVKAS